MLQYPRPSLRSARVVVGALLAGPLAFFGLASFLIGHFGGGMLPADAELTPGQAFWIWVAIAIGCFVPALMLRSRVVSRVEASMSWPRAPAPSVRRGETVTSACAKAPPVQYVAFGTFGVSSVVVLGGPKPYIVVSLESLFVERSR